jgi:O-6-methylguanine DNA methyltransferase
LVSKERPVEAPVYHLFRTTIDDVWFCVVVDEETRLVSCAFSPTRYINGISALLKPLPPGSDIREDDVDAYALSVLHNLHQLYEGTPVEARFPLSFDHMSVFKRKALEATMMIPWGYVSSYGEIARKLGKRGAARAVGRVEATNPFPLIVPCHRVIRSTRVLGAYGGGQEVKRGLLEREGVRFHGNRVARECFWTFPS